MAITTIDGIIAGYQPPQLVAKAVTPTLVAGKLQSLWGLGGWPGSGDYNLTANGLILTSTNTYISGMVPRSDSNSGFNYLARLTGAATQPGLLILCDRLWQGGGYTITSSTTQAIVCPVWPARDSEGSSRGLGVQIGLEVSSVCGAAAPTLTISYTNHLGSGSRTATNVFPTANAPTAGSFFTFGLQAGDQGVESVEQFKMSISWVSGAVNLVAYRPLAALELTAAQVPNAIDAITGGLPKMYPGTVPFFLFLPSTTTAANISATYVETWG